MKNVFLYILLLLLSTNIAAADIELLHANEWAVPKKTATILSMPAIKKSMMKLNNNTNSTLRIRYPGGDEGTLWVNELRSWLIALGLSSNRIELIQGSAVSTAIELEVITE